MEVNKCIKESFAVIGKQGSTLDGEGFIQKLWEDANAHFEQVAHLAKKDANGSIAGIWGAMSDFSHTYMPWEDNFSRGLYLAGVECVDGAEAPEGWTKWRIPSFEYLYVECSACNVFAEMLEYLNAKQLSLAGAVQEFTNPQTGKQYMFFPIKAI